jgi:hypothetical protein
MKRGAYCLASVLLAISFALLCGLAISREAVQNTVLLRLRRLETRVFYLSESGLEHGKSHVAGDNLWFTETAPVTDNKNRLLTVSAGAIYLFGHGGYKVIREKNKNRIYSIGFIGNDILKSRGHSFQRIDIEFPLKTTKWAEF